MVEAGGWDLLEEIEVSVEQGRLFSAKKRGGVFSDEAGTVKKLLAAHLGRY